MKKTFFQKLLTVVLCLTLAVSAAACGGNTDGNAGANVENSGGNQVESTDSGNSGSGSFADVVASVASDVKEAAAGAPPVTIYKVGSDLIAFCVKSNECSRLKSTDPSKNSDWQLSLRTEDYNTQVQFEEYGSYCWWHEHEGDEGQHASSNYENSYLTDDTCFETISYPGICDTFKLEGELTFEAHNGMQDKHEEIAKFDASAAVKNITLEELADIAAEICGKEVTEGDWAGVYKSDGYGDVNGLAEVSVTEHGGIIIHTVIDGQEKTYVGYEATPEGYEPNDEYIYMDIKLLNGPNEFEHEDYTERISIQYSKHFDWSSNAEGLSWSYDKWTRDGESEYKYTSLNAFTERFVAPKDYVDEDPTGLLARKDPDDDQYFKPATDDYVISVNANYSFEDDKKCQYYTLNSFDVNGFTVEEQKMKMVFENAADAKAYYDKQLANYGDSYNYKLSDNILYYSYKRSNNSTRNLNSKYSTMRQGYGDWYVNCHYAKGWYNEEGKPEYVTYISKPYTDKEFKMSLEDTVFWDSIPNGDHRSLETKDAYLSLYISSYDLDVRFTGYGELDSEGHRFVGNIPEFRFTGKSFVGANLDYQWNYQTDKVEYYLFFTEIEFDEKEAQATQYWFKLADENDASVTFDNFKTKTPELVLTQKYDMTRAENGY